MSAIAKPTAIMAGSLTPTLVINVDNIKAIEKIDIPAIQGAKAQWGILVTYNEPTSLPSKVMFVSSSARNTSFTNLETLVGANVA